MNVLDIVRRRIQLLYEKHPNIHVNVTLKRPHKVIVNMVLRSYMNLVINNAESISEDLLLALFRDPEVDFSYKTTLLEMVAKRLPKDKLELILESLGAEKILDNLNGGNRYVDVTNSNEQILSALYNAKVINKYEKQADGKHYKKLRFPHS